MEMKVWSSRFIWLPSERHYCNWFHNHHLWICKKVKKFHRFSQKKITHLGFQGALNETERLTVRIIGCSSLIAALMLFLPDGLRRSRVCEGISPTVVAWRNTTLRWLASLSKRSRWRFSRLIDKLSRSLRAEVKLDNESDSKFSFFW